MRKRIDSAADGSWIIYDSSRNASNVIGEVLFAESSTTFASDTLIDFTSNGFKIRNAAAGNTSGATYIFAAFAEVPSKYALAR